MMRNLALLMCLSLPAAAQDLSSVPHDLTADVVLLGETHDNPLHHLGQADMIRRLAPKAVVFEMLSPDQAQQVNADPKTDISGLGDRIGWPDYRLYQPIFEALGEIPAVGAAAPREDVRRAFSEGALGVYGAEGAKFGLSVALPAEQQEIREQAQFDAHCEAMPLEMMTGMVEAQRYRDARFAAATLKALETYGAPVVLVAGNGHTRRDWAVPFMISQAQPSTTTFSIGFVEAPHMPEDVLYDVTIVTEAAERSDPCDTFRK